LKLIRERDEDVDILDEQLINDDVQPPISSPPLSPDSAIDSRVPEEEDKERSKFERLMMDKMELNMPASDNGLYLARTVAPVLTKALAEVLLRRPADPIGFISEWLVRYHDDEPKR